MVAVKCTQCHAAIRTVYQYPYPNHPGQYWQFYYCDDCGHSWDNYDPAMACDYCPCCGGPAHWSSWDDQRDQWSCMSCHHTWYEQRDNT